MLILIHYGDATVPNFSLSQELQKNYMHTAEKAEECHTPRQRVIVTLPSTSVPIKERVRGNTRI